MVPKLKKIMYVDDAPDLRTMVEASLGRLGGYDMRLCDSGETALVEVLEFAPDLILLDVMMSGISGPDTLHIMQQADELSSIPVVFMTSKATANEIEQYKQLGAIDVVPKPFDPMQLADILEAIWRNAHRVV